MKFCTHCKKILDSITNRGKLQFQCANCKVIIPATAEDSLLDEGIIGEIGSEQVYATFIDLAAYDVTNRKINEECPECKRGFLTFIRVGENEQVIKTCECGYVSKLSSSK